MKNRIIAFGLTLVFLWGNSNLCLSNVVQQQEDKKVQSDQPSKDKKRQDIKKGKAKKRRLPALKKAQMAPDFELKSLDGKSTTKLSSFRGKKPVVLFFGSYT